MLESIMRGVNMSTSMWGCFQGLWGGLAICESAEAIGNAPKAHVCMIRGRINSRLNDKVPAKRRQTCCNDGVGIQP